MWTPRKHVLDAGAHWRHLANMTELSMCVGDATFFSNYFDHVLHLATTKVIRLNAILLKPCLKQLSDSPCCRCLIAWLAYIIKTKTVIPEEKHSRCYLSFLHHRPAAKRFSLLTYLLTFWK